MEHTGIEDLGHYVVRMPGRAFPGIVIQGDTLFNLVTQTRNLRDALRGDPGASRLTDDADQILEVLHERLDIYERVIEGRGKQLPYFKTDR